MPEMPSDFSASSSERAMWGAVFHRFAVCRNFQRPAAGPNIGEGRDRVLNWCPVNAQPRPEADNQMMVAGSFDMNMKPS
jgi:hypothetical protein